MKLIPVNMEGIDSKAVRRSLDGLKNKNVLGIFPEGTRSMDGVIKKDVHSGAAYLAIKGGVPVFPAAIKGTFKALPPGASKVAKTPVSLRFGDPIFPPQELSKESVERMSNTIMDTISHLFNELPERS
jgi:1-acyl-sn-glycerol-3-phosphate acyltransferase